jgi:hypothetical protein
VIIRRLLCLQHKDPINVRSMLVLDNVYYVILNIVFPIDTFIHLLQPKEIPKTVNTILHRAIENNLAVPQALCLKGIDYILPEILHITIILFR